MKTYRPEKIGMGNMVRFSYESGKGTRAIEIGKNAVAYLSNINADKIELSGRLDNRWGQGVLCNIYNVAKSFINDLEALFAKGVLSRPSGIELYNIEKPKVNKFF